MKNYILILACVFAGFAAPDALAVCQAGGPYQQDNRFYNHAQNGVPTTKISGTNAPECWTISNESNGTSAGVLVDSDSSCGYTANAFEFHGNNQTLEQTVAIPGSLAGTNWSLDYLVDFIDPNNDGTWNKLYVRVYDADTNTLLASDYWDGLTGDLTCSLRSITFSGSYSDLRIQVQVSNNYSNTHIRLRGIALWNWYN